MADSTLNLAESRGLVRNLIGDPDGDGITDAQINDIYNMAYQRFHGEHVHSYASMLTSFGQKQNMLFKRSRKLAGFENPVTTRSILRVELIRPGMPNTPLERVSRAELFRRLGNDATIGRPTAFSTTKDYGYNIWEFWFHPRPDGFYQFDVWAECSPIDLTADADQPQGLTGAESVALAHMVAYHCAVLLGRRERIRQIVELIPETERLRFNLRQIALRPEIRPDEAHV